MDGDYMKLEYKRVRSIAIYSPPINGLKISAADLAYLRSLRAGSILLDFYHIELGCISFVTDDIDLCRPFPDLVIMQSVTALLPETYSEKLWHISLEVRIREWLESGIAFEFIDNKNIGFSAWVKSHPVSIHVDNSAPNMHFTQAQRESILNHLHSASEIFEDSVKRSTSPNDYSEDFKEMASYILEHLQHFDGVVDKYEKSRSVAATYKRKARGGYVGVKKGASRITQKEEYALPRIVAWSASFNGSWNDYIMIKSMRIKSDTYKKYKAEILELKQSHRGTYQQLCEVGAIIKSKEHVIKEFDRNVDYRKQNRKIGLSLTTRQLRSDNGKGEKK